MMNKIFAGFRRAFDSNSDKGRDPSPDRRPLLAVDPWAGGWGVDGSYFPEAKGY
jgi:hypothetical protein